MKRIIRGSKDSKTSDFRRFVFNLSRQISADIEEVQRLQEEAPGAVQELTLAQVEDKLADVRRLLETLN